jgi:hypothetical protein
LGLLGDHKVARLAGRCCPCFRPPKVTELQEEKQQEVTQEEVTQEEAPPQLTEQEVKQEEDKPVDKMTTKLWIV